jgi:hypothetical protein
MRRPYRLVTPAHGNRAELATTAVPGGTREPPVGVGPERTTPNRRRSRRPAQPTAANAQGMDLTLDVQVGFDALEAMPGQREIRHFPFQHQVQEQ